MASLDPSPLITTKSSCTQSSIEEVPQAEAKSYIEDDDEYTIVLYYQYVNIANVEGVCDDQIALCNRHSLKGRIRVSPEGINGTLGGRRADILEYIRFMNEDVLLSATPIHWKLSTLLPHRDPERQKFQQLSVKPTKEVVSMDLHDEMKAKLDEIGAGSYLTPREFHRVIEEALEEDKAENVVLIDVRNIYETRIGRFDVADESDSKIMTIDPETRSFSEFKKFAENIAEDISDKKVLMYCTGGVRCERATAYMKLLGVRDVFHLYGGIHQYMEDFPEGGFFKGKNFVYDPRISIPYRKARENQVIGRCMCCSTPFDDYRPQSRCQACRMLVLVCDTCRVRRAREGEAAPRLLCEKCNE